MSKSNLFTEERLDVAVELSISDVKKRAVKGVAILTGRGFLLNGISQVSWILLPAFLSPSEVGVFLLVNAAVSFLIYFSDIGLAAALIQKKETPSKIELYTTFTIQQLLIIVLLLFLFLLSPMLVDHYDLADEGKYLMYALGFSLFLSSLKSIPSVLLERKLEFGKFVIPEILENLTYSIIVVFLAFKGFGISSFTYAVLARGIVGVIAMYILMPWRPGFALSKNAIKKLFSFGVPYQANTLISVFKDQGITLILGSILPTSAIGILGFAMRLSQMPLRLFMDNVTKVSFPAFSRMQEDKNELSKTVTLSVKFITFLVFPFVFGVVALISDLIKIFPVYQKWEIGIFAFYIISINTLFAASATILTNLLTAIGKIKITIMLTIMYTILTIILVPLFAILWGVNGAALGYAFVGVSSVVAIIVAYKFVHFDVVESIFKPLLAALIMTVFVLFFKNLLATNFINLFVISFAGAGIYLISAYLLFGKSLILDAKKIITNFIKK